MISLILTQFMLILLCVVSVSFTYGVGDKKKPIIKSGIIGAFLGLLFGMCFNSQNKIEFSLIFSLSGILAAWLYLQLLYTVQKAVSTNRPVEYYDDGMAPRFYITGDKHRHYEKVKAFCRDLKTRKKDVLIILGDSGFNYYNDIRDDKLKSEIALLNITLFCVHGNKENRPQNVGTYGVRSFCGGKVYYEPKYPNILFAIDGEIYTFEGKKYIVVGGAHSVDKVKCIEEGLPFWNDEMPDDTIKQIVENNLNSQKNRIYGMLTHTCPIKYLPTEMFISTRQNEVIKKSKKKDCKKTFKPDIDRSTEEWLGTLEEKINYKVWYCGHYHVDKQIDKINMMYVDIKPLHYN